MWCVCVCASMGEEMLISLHPPLHDKAQKQDVNDSQKALLLSDTQKGKSNSRHNVQPPVFLRSHAGLRGNQPPSHKL